MSLPTPIRKVRDLRRSPYSSRACFSPGRGPAGPGDHYSSYRHRLDCPGKRRSCLVKRGEHVDPSHKETIGKSSYPGMRPKEPIVPTLRVETFDHLLERGFVRLCGSAFEAPRPL